ncbi:hypothetical protein P0Y35_10215 [Kiritimatiellaeota bacterium B1221]|nr:hypothetical protein [Kiritimatiellaeota bacterium B1221]
MKKSSPPPFPKKKPSKSADASFQDELKRLRNMTVEEKILEALSIKENIFGFSSSPHGS